MTGSPGTETTTKVTTPEASFKFVTLSHPDDIRRRKKVQTEIRRHVMKDIGKQRRRPKSSSTTTTKQSTVTSSSETDTALTSPDRSLPHFGGFPIPTDMRSFELVRFAKESNSVYFPFREIWFDLSLADPGAFYVTIGNAAVLWKMSLGGDSSFGNESKQHFSQSLIQLRKRLNNPEEHKSTGTISNILAHICLTMRYADWTGCQVHLDGLKLVWETRGGFLDLTDHVQTLIMQYDLAGAIVFDRFPRFPLPPALVDAQARTLPPPLSSQLQEVLGSVLQSRYMAPARDALSFLSLVAHTINMRSHSPSFWKRDMEGINIIGPCIHFLLSMPRLVSPLVAHPSPSDLIAMEMVRLTGLMLMSTLKEPFLYYASERPALEDKLVDFLAAHVKYVTEEHDKLLRWILVTACLMQRNDLDMRIQVLLRKGCEQSNVSIRELVEWAKEVIWINVIEAPFEDKLIQDLDC